MPTVLRAEGFAFRIYTDDHGPAHVHVWGSGGTAKFHLSPLAIVAAKGLSKRELRTIVTVLLENRDYLLQTWKDIHHD